MVTFKFKLDGFEEILSIEKPDSLQRLKEHYSVASRFYFLDELILALGGSGKQLSVSHSNCTLKQIADLNKLSDVFISFDKQMFKKIV